MTIHHILKKKNIYSIYFLPSYAYIYIQLSYILV